MSSLKDQSSDAVATEALDNGMSDLAAGHASFREGAFDPLANAAEAERGWDRLAQQRKWMIAVYQWSQATRFDVVRIKRAHLNDQSKVRVAVEVGSVVRERETDVLTVDERRVLDMPTERILWFEIIDEMGQHDVPLFEAALEKGHQASREIEQGAAEAIANAAWRRPR